MGTYIFNPEDPRIVAVADALSDHYNNEVGWTWPSMAAAAMYALKEHYEANKPAYWVVIIKDVGMKKIQMIKEVRSFTQWGLKESKDFVEQNIGLGLVFPVLNQDINDAHKIARAFEAAGALVTIEERR